MEDSRGNIRRPFRVIAWLLGPLCLLSSLFLVVATLLEAPSGFRQALRDNIETLGTALGMALVGCVILHAAITGRGIYVPGDED